MAGRGNSGSIGRIIFLLVLISVLVAGGIYWFDYLNVFDFKNYYSVLPFAGDGGRTGTDPAQGEMINIDSERYFILLETINFRNAELDNKEQQIEIRNNYIAQMAQEIEERQKAVEEQEKSFNAKLQEAENKDRNVDQNARNLTGMPPQRAVGILAMMDDQDVIDVLRKTEQIAQEEGTSSLVSYWLSLMEPDRAAEISRKMVNRPMGINP